MTINRFNLPLVLALAAALTASPALAQGNGKGRGNNDDDRRRVEQRDRDRDRDDDDRWDDDRRDDRDSPRFERRDSRNGRRVPPGWCIGRGNPHNTAANCRYNSSRGAWERYDSRDRRWETQGTWERGSNDRYGDRGSYDAAHRDFHYSHDRQCRERAAQRPLDLRWQVQVRQECRAIHEDFHRRWGISH
jgi:hypothetical protein